MQDDEITRRQLLGTLAASGLASATPATAEPPILPLTSTSGVWIPPRGRSFMKFSFDFPEPSVEFNGLQFSFRIYTVENTYAPDASQMRAENTANGTSIHCARLVFAGGQKQAPGSITAHLRRTGNAVEWDTQVEAPYPIKCIATIVRGIPRGKLAPGGGNFFDPQNNEVLFGYPFGGGALFQGARGIDTPLVVLDSGNRKFFGLSAADDQVHAHRFYFQPGDNGYRIELISEPHGWDRSNAWKTPLWRVIEASNAEQASSQHYEHVERAFGLPEWKDRRDIPAWFNQISLVVALHGMHWTGYVLNDFAKMRRILEWTATQIPGHRVMVFLPAWDGRYYWNYPIYQAEERLGGEAGLRELIRVGHALGFRFVAMYGTNSANTDLAMYDRIAAGASTTVDGIPFRLNWVDWDNDRQFENSFIYMNLGVPEWRNWLTARISDAIERYQIDGYFLDIVGGWVNNTKGDLHEGTRELVEELRSKHPNVLAVGEMSYDALYSVIPVYQVGAGRFSKYCRTFRHLSNPAPGRGSSGVHESGFGAFNLEAQMRTGNVLPTITVVDDTFENHRDEMSKIIAAAKQAG